MKRTEFIRKTPMPRTPSVLGRHSPVRVKSARRERQTQPSGSRIPEAVAAAVLERAAGECEACTAPMRPGDTVLHHRLPLSAGGENTVENLMAVHGGVDGGCHNLNAWSIHNRPTRSYRCGHLVRRGDDPAPVPVIPLPDIREITA